MNIKKKVWIAGGLIAALALGGLVAATGESPLAALGNGCCRVSISPTDEPMPLPVPVPLPDLPPVKQLVDPASPDF